ncbi:hypothetical protein [Natrialbaceae archaeon AArc-T1-2]|uniref:hypothetical protein n=1 Tax=Natrialbaceae archaeon AArc-T1-2 TaxID=3053904 RepID=UPI00255AE46A|nr:hypothetical protein [Natrialbaceae archaeon AArc-T1-2]WIV67980.1 hypothetical protein QQ977_04410 [Natrialbaceae archaeon AArc-T1-2]
MSRDGDGGFSEGLESSRGDPRVVLALNALLSTAFAWTVVWGLDLLGVMTFSLVNVATGALLLFVVTYVVTRP